MAAKVQRHGESARNIIQSIGQTVGGFAEQEVERIKPRRRAVAVTANGRPVEYGQLVGHGPLNGIAGGRWQVRRATGGESCYGIAAMSAIPRSLRSVSRVVLDALLPPRCLACGTLVGEPGALCPECFSGVEFLVDPVCAACGDPFELPMTPGALCAVCIEDPPPWRHARGGIQVRWRGA